MAHNTEQRPQRNLWPRCAAGACASSKRARAIWPAAMARSRSFWPIPLSSCADAGASGRARGPGRPARGLRAVWRSAVHPAVMERIDIACAGFCVFHRDAAASASRAIPSRTPKVRIEEGSPNCCSRRSQPAPWPTGAGHHARGARNAVHGARDGPTRGAHRFRCAGDSNYSSGKMGYAIAEAAGAAGAQGGLSCRGRWPLAAPAGGSRCP